MEEIQKEKIGFYRKLIEGNSDIKLKGASMPYTSVNGHMFSQLSKSGLLGIRLPEAERKEFLKKYNTKLFESYGAVLKEYVTVPDSLLENTDELKKYFELSHQYVMKLKPKPSKKK